MKLKSLMRWFRGLMEREKNPYQDGIPEGAMGEMVNVRVDVDGNLERRGGYSKISVYHCSGSSEGFYGVKGYTKILAGNVDIGFGTIDPSYVTDLTNYYGEEMYWLVSVQYGISFSSSYNEPLVYLHTMSKGVEAKTCLNDWFELGSVGFSHEEVMMNYFNCSRLFPTKMKIVSYGPYVFLADTKNMFVIDLATYHTFLEYNPKEYETSYTVENDIFNYKIFGDNGSTGETIMPPHLPQRNGFIHAMRNVLSPEHPYLEKRPDTATNPTINGNFTTPYTTLYAFTSFEFIDGKYSPLSNPSQIAYNILSDEHLRVVINPISPFPYSSKYWWGDTGEDEEYPNIPSYKDRAAMTTKQGVEIYPDNSLEIKFIWVYLTTYEGLGTLESPFRPDMTPSSIRAQTYLERHTDGYWYQTGHLGDEEYKNCVFIDSFNDAGATWEGRIYEGSEYKKVPAVATLPVTDMCVHKERVVIIVERNGEAKHLEYSDAGNPLHFPRTNVRAVGAEFGSDLIAIKSVSDYLYIILEKSIYVITGDIEIGQTICLSESVGGLSNDLVVESNGVVYFIALDGLYAIQGLNAPVNLTKNKCDYLFDQREAEPINIEYLYRKIVAYTEVTTPSSGAIATAGKVSLCASGVNKRDGEVLFAFPVGHGDMSGEVYEKQKVLVFNHVLGIVYLYQFKRIINSIESIRDMNTGEEKIVLVTDDGLFELDGSQSDDGEAIEFYAETEDIRLGSQTLKKVFRFFRVYGHSLKNIELTYSVDGAVRGTVIQEDREVFVPVWQEGRATSLKVKISGISADAPFSISEILVGFEQLAGIR